MRSIFLVFLVMSFIPSRAQEPEFIPEPPPDPGSLPNPVQEEQVYEHGFVEEPAEFPGGLTALNSFVEKNMKYPPFAMENEISGKVYVEFVIETTGKVSNIKIKRGAHKSLDKEAIRIIETMPKWKPAKHKGQVVKQRYIHRIIFSLD